LPLGEIVPSGYLCVRLPSYHVRTDRSFPQSRIGVGHFADRLLDGIEPQYELTSNDSPRRLSIFFRLSFVTFYVLLAEMFLGFDIQNCVSLVGAIAICAFSFYLPYIYYWRLHPDTSTGKRFALRIGFLFGVSLSLGGIYFTIDQMGQMQTAGLFSGACHENSFFIGRYTFSGYLGSPNDGGYSRSRDPGSFYDTIYKATCGSAGDIDCGQFDACCQVVRGAVVCSPLSDSEHSSNASQAII